MLLSLWYECRNANQRWPPSVRCWHRLRLKIPHGRVFADITQICHSIWVASALDYDVGCLSPGFKILNQQICAPSEIASKVPPMLAQVPLAGRQVPCLREQLLLVQLVIVALTRIHRASPRSRWPRQSCSPSSLGFLALLLDPFGPRRNPRPIWQEGALRCVAKCGSAPSQSSGAPTCEPPNGIKTHASAPTLDRRRQRSLFGWRRS